MMSRTKALGMAALLLCSSGTLPGQAPVPRGEQANLTIQGRVTDIDNKALQGVSVAATNLQTGVSRSTTTNEGGRYSVSGLVAGMYRVNATLSGFMPASKDIRLAPGEPGIVDLRLGGPVPVGNPNPPAPALGSTEVVKNTFANDTSLRAWLNEQAGKGRRLVGVTPIEDKTSLFVFKIVRAERNTAVVVSAIGVLDAKDLGGRLQQDSSKSFLGVHRINSSSYLILLR
jgi:hypothetical protein